MNRSRCCSLPTETSVSDMKQVKTPRSQGAIAQFSSVEGSRREPRRHASMGTPKRLLCSFGADYKVVLASTLAGREAYAGGGFHTGRGVVATTHATCRHILCAWAERPGHWQPNLNREQHTASHWQSATGSFRVPSTGTGSKDNHY